MKFMLFIRDNNEITAQTESKLKEIIRNYIRRIGRSKQRRQWW